MAIINHFSILHPVIVKRMSSPESESAAAADTKVAPESNSAAAADTKVVPTFAKTIVRDKA